MTNPRVDISVGTRTLWWLAVAPIAGLAALGAAMLLPLSAARTAILAICLSVAAVALVAALVMTKRHGGLDHVAAGRAMLNGSAGESATALPSQLPSAWGPRRMGTVWWIGFVSWILLSYVLLVADTETPSEIRQIQAAGGEITELEVSAATAVEVQSQRAGRRGWSQGHIAQQLELNVPGGQNVVVETRTDEPIETGETVEVFYAADDPDAGLYIAPDYRDFWGPVPEPSGHHGDMQRVVDGKSVSGLSLTFVAIVWVLLAAMPLLSWALGGRRAPLSQLDDWVRAIHGHHDGQFFRGVDGVPLEFRPDGVSHLKPRSKALNGALADRHGWMCWDPAGVFSTGIRDNTHAATAAFVGDDGWVVHGVAIFGADDDPRQRGATAGSQQAPVDARRTVRIFSPRSIRPLLVSGFTAGCGLLAVGSLAALLAGVSGLWSVLLAVFAFLCLVLGWAGLPEPVEKQRNTGGQ